MILPVWITNLPKIENFQFHYVDLVEQHNRFVESKLRGNSFIIDDSNKVWDHLYSQFLNKVTELFGPLTLLSNNKRAVWLYPANKDWYRGGIHNHMKTSVINGVYYFSMPETDNYRDGSIAFYDDNDNEIWIYKPRECDLLIFPNYLKHQPLPVKTEKYRFAINMEIFCTWPSAFGKPTDRLNLQPKQMELEK